MADQALSRPKSARKKVRKPIPKKTRFEVFKRDKFTCQYCGSAAPDAVLHVDHIHPVVDDGGNEITNLITSCRDCNLGKGPRKISDDSALSKQRKQMEDLQERREQIEMMADWRRGLADIEQGQVAVLSDLIFEATGFRPNERGRSFLRKWVKRFGLTLAVECSSISFEQYFDDSGAEEEMLATWEHAFNMIPRIAAVRADGGAGDLRRRSAYIRGILRNRMNYLHERDAAEVIREAFEAGIDPDEVEDLAKRSFYFRDFTKTLWGWIFDEGGQQ